jgi:anti-sigma regulatory factor (Ser/Thr protein kinase)
MNMRRWELLSRSECGVKVKKTVLDARSASVVHDARQFVLKSVQPQIAKAGKVVVLEHAARSCEEMELAVGEAVANVIRHAAKPPGTFELIVEVNRKTVIATVTDYGPGFSFDSRRMPDPTAVDGRGIPLMHALCDAVEYRRNYPNELRLLKNLP